MTTDSTGPRLQYRLATDSDLELLKRFRVECGWGLERLEKFWGNLDRPICVFTLEGKGVVGMGGWILELEGDPEAASREQRSVQITSLYISHKLQSSGLGRFAMDLLEKAAVELYGAQTLTIETTAYANELINGVFTEIIGQPSKQIQWYRRRGYEVYRPNQPKYPAPTAEQPDRLLVATFLKKCIA